MPGGGGGGGARGQTHQRAEVLRVRLGHVVGLAHLVLQQVHGDEGHDVQGQDGQVPHQAAAREAPEDGLHAVLDEVPGLGHVRHPTAPGLPRRADLEHGRHGMQPRLAERPRQVDAGSVFVVGVGHDALEGPDVLRRRPQVLPQLPQGLRVDRGTRVVVAVGRTHLAGCFLVRPSV